MTLPQILQKGRDEFDDEFWKYGTAPEEPNFLTQGNLSVWLEKHQSDIVNGVVEMIEKNKKEVYECGSGFRCDGGGCCGNKGEIDESYNKALDDIISELKKVL